MIEITETKTEYTVKDNLNNLEIRGVVEKDGKISIRPHDGEWGGSFNFVNSKPEITLGIANLIAEFAKMVINEQGEGNNE